MTNFLKVVFISFLSLQSQGESFINRFQPKKKNFSMLNGITNSDNSDFTSKDTNYEYATEYYEYLIKFDKIEPKKKIFKFGSFDNFDFDKYIEIAKAREVNYRIFERNILKIKNHNNYEKFSLGINKFTDIIDFEKNNQDDLMKKTISKKEIVDYDLKAFKQLLQNPQFYQNKMQNISKSLSWMNYVSEVKDQGPCGSCWAFSTTGALEGYMRANNYSIDRLSEQELVDCSNENYGCGGGLMHLAFDYIIDENGLSSNKNYPYTAKDGDCKCKQPKCDNDSCECDDCTNHTVFNKINHIGTNITDYMFTIPRSITDIMSSLKFSPISIALDASQFEFRFYQSGVIDLPSNISNTINHAVLLVGYDYDEEGPYWIIQNSWGKDWGDNGYAKIRIRNGDGVLLSQLYGVYPKY